MNEITTVGSLRSAISDIPDDVPIWSQVCAKDGSSWTLQATIADIHQAQPRKLVISLRHPALLTLPGDEWYGCGEHEPHPTEETTNG